mgnify:CR=1 FL=1
MRVLTKAGQPNPKLAAEMAALQALLLRRKQKTAGAKREAEQKAVRRE